MSWIPLATVDGLLGALIGGGVTAGTVAWTLHSQSRSAAVEAAVVAVTRLQAACGALQLLSSSQRITEQEARAAYDRVLTAAMEARARLLHRWPTQAATLAEALEKLAQASEGKVNDTPVRAYVACNDIIAACRKWLEDSSDH